MSESENESGTGGTDTGTEEEGSITDTHLCCQAALWAIDPSLSVYTCSTYVLFDVMCACGFVVVVVWLISSCS